MLLMLSLFGYLYRQDALYTAFGFTTQPVVIGLMIIMSFIAAPYNELVSVATSYMSRKMEFAGSRVPPHLPASASEQTDPHFS
jgi:STE24 endopeptidase